MPAGAVKATRILYACQRVGVATVPAALLLPFFPLSCPMDGGVAWSSRCRWLHCTALHWWHQLSCRAEGQSAAEPAPSPPPPPVSESLCRYPSRRVWGQGCSSRAALRCAIEHYSSSTWVDGGRGCALAWMFLSFCGGRHQLLCSRGLGDRPRCASQCVEIWTSSFQTRQSRRSLARSPAVRSRAAAAEH